MTLMNVKSLKLRNSCQ